MSSELFTIDYMQREDIPFIREIEKQCFSELWPEDGFERELTNTKVALYLVLKIDGEVAGYMGSWLILEEAHITTFGVKPKFQGKKIATILLLRFMREAIARGVRWSTLEVNEKNRAAIALYEKFGFKKVGVRKKYYNGTDDGHIMWVGKIYQPDYSLKLDEIEAVDAKNIDKKYLSGKNAGDTI